MEMMKKAKKSKMSEMSEKPTRLTRSAAGRSGETSSSVSVTTNLLSLPDSILLEVLTFLSVRDLVRSSRVCKRWKRLVLDKSLWKNVDLTPFKLTSTQFWQVMRHWFSANLHTLRLTGILHTVRRLEFLTPAILQVLGKRYSVLNHLHLHKTNLHSLSFDCFPLSLKTLELTECELPLSWLKSSKGQTKGVKLEELILKRVPSFTNRHLQIICSVSNLKTLSLSGCYRINDVGMQRAIPYLRGLQHLKLKLCRITDITMHLIGCHMKTLRTLSVIDFQYLSDEGLACLSGIKTLEKLSLHGCYFFSTDSIIDVCARLPVLNHLCLDGIFFKTQEINSIRKSLPHCTVTNSCTM